MPDSRAEATSAHEARPASGWPVRSADRRDLESLRPAFHYTARKNMINDPNGLLFYAGVYHLFHQYNQHEVVHWGHAISDDLVHWRHLPPAIFPDHNGQIYSGTAVIDLHDVAGLQTGPHPTFLAFFTFADHSDGTQSQGMAFSTDCGATWTMHPGNPIVPNPGVRDFRDPKVLRHDPSGSWVMVIAAGNHVEFFRSHDLTNWTMAGSFGAGEGAHGGGLGVPRHLRAARQR